MHHVELISGTSELSISKKSFYTVEDIDYRESRVKLHENRVKCWEQIHFKCYKSVYTVFLGTLTDFPGILQSFHLQK